MLYEYALISVVIASGYWGYFFLRNSPTGTPLFGMMHVGAALASLLGLLGSDRHAAFGVAGAIGLGAGACLLIVGPLVRAAARRFAAAERVGIAQKLLDVAEILAPGSGVAEEKALLGAMKEIREGRVEQTVDALVAAKYNAPADARLAIDERIAMLYLAAYRWRDAIDHAETHLIPAIEGPPKPDQVSLRDALGIAPPVWVELLGAYGRTGNLDQAARMMSRLEDVCRGREDAAHWVHRARMMFLALAGRPDAVRVLLEPRRARHMSKGARTYWVAIAHEQHGDREAAAAAYEKARGKARGRPRELIDEALARLHDIKRVELSPEATEVVAKIEAAPLPGPIRFARAQVPWATWGITLVLLAVAGAIAWAFGSSSDLGVLLRAGAMVRGRVDDGEWWRLVTCIFIHVGSVHLAVNAIGLFFLGRIVEEVFGTARTIVIFIGSGLAGAVASYLSAPVGVSAGASGAIFGILGAIFIELTLHRERYRAAWKRGMWGGLVVVTIAQAAVGFLYPVIDQWAHGAGLLGGIALGALLSRHTRWERITVHAARVLAVVAVGVAITAGVLVARTSVADAFGGPQSRHYLSGVAITAPASWLTTKAFHDPDSLVVVIGARESVIEPVGQIGAWLVETEKNAKQHDFEPTLAPDRVLALPAGWEGSELVATIEDPMGHTLRYRMIAIGKRFGDVLVLLRVTAPESVLRAAPEVFQAMIESAGPD
jgi:membrane associated rhomboid family serine protease